MDSTPQAYITRMLSFVGDDDPLTILGDTPLRLSDLVTSVDAETRRRRPDPRHWSINEIVAHMADVELVFGYRFRMILSSNGTPLQAFDQDVWASTLHYNSCDAVDSAHSFAAVRSTTLRVLGLVDPKLFENFGDHPERGRESVTHLIRFLAGHDRNHLEQIERIIGATA